jgi:hypothetical protein
VQLAFSAEDYHQNTTAKNDETLKVGYSAIPT